MTHVRRFVTRLARLLPLFAVALGCLPAPTPVSAAVIDRSASIGGSGLQEFDQRGAQLGALQTSRTRAYDGRHSVRATVTGNGNAYSRGIFDVDWGDGDDVWYGTAIYLPRGFHAALQGQVDLLRWDNWVTDPTTTDRSGIVIWRSDRRVHLIRQRLGVEEQTIAPTFRLPEGRWVWLEVHQRLSRGAGALNEVFLDGRLVTRSRTANTYGRRIERLRAGIVATDAVRQQRPLSLWFDRVTIRRGRPAGLPPRRP